MKLFGATAPQGAPWARGRKAGTLSLGAGLLAAACGLPPAHAQDASPAPSASPADAPAEAPSAEVQAFLKEWAEAMREVRTLRVRFKQTKKLRILKRPLIREGETLLKGRRVLMVTRGADGEPETELLVTPDEARLFHPRLKRLEVFPIAPGSAPPTPFPLFGSDLADLPQRYRLRLEVHPEPGERTLILVPRAASSPLAETRMRFRGTRILRVAQKSRRGDEVVIEVSAFEINPTLDGELQLVIPEGTTQTKLGG